MKKILGLFLLFAGLVIVSPVMAHPDGGGPGKRHKTQQTYHPRSGGVSLRPYWAGKRSPRSKTHKNMPSTTRKTW